MPTPIHRAYVALARSLNDPNTDASGYLRYLRDNILPGIDFELIKQDIEQGAGNELERKFLATHSSAALVVNAFGVFKGDKGPRFVSNGITYDRLTFERPCPTGLRGTPPNLDCWFDADTKVFAVESKLTEYFTPKKAVFSDSYRRNALADPEGCWWDVLEEAKTAGRRCLDVAQLVKHYLGLRRYMREHETERVEMLYVYWEPTNAENISQCVEHRKEVEKLAEAVKESAVRFSAQSYSTLWKNWDQRLELKEHVANLRRRYEIKI